MGYTKRFYKSQVFAITFFSYASYHCSRTIWSYSQKYMQESLPNYSKDMTGYANLTFLFVYGISMKILGSQGGRWNLKYCVGIGSIAASLIQLLIGLLGLFGILNPYLTFVLMGLNGVSQSTGWPCLVGIMGNWYQGKNIGMLMGIWSGNSNLGDIIGLLIGDIIIQRLGYSCYYAIITGSIIFGISAILIFFIPNSPTEVQGRIKLNNAQLEDIESEEMPFNNESRLLEQQDQTSISFCSTWCLPGVALYTLGYICLKGTFLGFLFWLPSYFQSIPSLESQSSYIAQMFDYGTFLGGMIIGKVGDIYKMRSVFIFPSLLVGCGFMVVVKYSLVDTVWLYYLVIFGIGVTQGGPYNNISGTIAIELSNTPKLEGNKRAISLVTSIIEGTGTLSGAFFQVVIPFIGENQLFLLFTVVTGLASLVVFVIMVKEIRRKIKPN